MQFCLKCLHFRDNAKQNAHLQKFTKIIFCQNCECFSDFSLLRLCIELFINILETKKLSIHIAVLPTLPMLYLNSLQCIYSLEAVLPPLPMLYRPFNVYLDSKRVSTLIRSSFATITNVVPSLQCIS